MTGADDQEPTAPAGGPAAGDLAAMVRVLEQRCRDAEGQARLAEEGRRRFEQLFHQQQVQTDINAQRRQQAEDAYQQVRGCLARVAAQLQHTGSPGADALATDLLTVVGGDPPPPPGAAAPPARSHQNSLKYIVFVAFPGMLDASTLAWGGAMRMRLRILSAVALAAGLGLLVLGLVGLPAIAADRSRGHGREDAEEAQEVQRLDKPIAQNSQRMLEEGQQTFRFDTFGSEGFFGVIGLHKAIEGARFPGGVGPGVSPRTALAVGLKVDVEALPGDVQDAIEDGKINLDDPATTLRLLQLNAVIGLTGFFTDPKEIKSGLKAVGIQCALCHSTVDDSLAPGIGHRRDGWANQDLNVGAILNLAPDLSAVDRLLGVDDATLRKVLTSWGPGKFDAEVFLDGKGFRPDGKTAATLIPSAFGLAGHNNHTWTGAWGTVTYWNAFVANLEMHGAPGTFFDPRLDNAAQFPVAARNHFGHVSAPPDDDRITPKLAALQFYQLAIPSPSPPAGSFNQAAAARGRLVFNGPGKCASCHVPPLFTEPGWNLHTPAEVGIDSFQADRAPDHRYRTSALAGRLFNRKTDQGRGFFHDGRFKSLLEVVDHYNDFMHLGLSPQQKSDLVEYLKSI